MALDKDICGLAVHTVRQHFNNKTEEQLVAQYGSLNAARLALTKMEIDEIFKHIKAFGIVNTTGTAAAQSGKIS